MTDKTKKLLLEMEQNIKDFVVEEDKKNYHALSNLIHKMSPETQEKIDDLREKLNLHDQREQMYWQKIDRMETSILELKTIFHNHSEDMNEHIQAINTLSDLLASGRVIKSVATLVGWVLVIIGGVLALKQWIIK